VLVSGIRSLSVGDRSCSSGRSHAAIKEVVGDKGYHKNETLAKCRAEELRTYICEPDGPNRRWTDKPADYEAAYRANRRRLKGDRNKRLQKLRCERVERSPFQTQHAGSRLRNRPKFITPTCTL